MKNLIGKFPSLPYIAPFAVFLVLLAVLPRLPIDLRTSNVIRLVLLGLVLWVFSRGIVTWRAPYWLPSILLGITVFLLWIAPDVLWPTWRGHWLFSNGLTGKAEGALPPAGQHDPVVLVLRTIRAVVMVPVVEELFWRGWLPRWLDNMEDFRKVPLGSYTPLAFGVTAILFASEHGSLWDVGLVAGVLYNAYMKKTASLADLILAHAVTNACLSAYVIIGGRWQYW